MLMQHRGDIAAWLRLQLTPGVGAVSTRRLLAAFSLPDQIFRQSQSALEAVVSEKQAKALLREPVGFSVALQNLEGWLNQSGQRFVALGDPDYPQSLLQSPDPPLCLYVQCADWQWWQLWAKEKQPPLLGMVGSRKPSPQGERTAQDGPRPGRCHGACRRTGRRGHGTGAPVGMNTNASRRISLLAAAALFLIFVRI